MHGFIVLYSSIWSSHQNHFKFNAWFHCIILINMWVFTSWYILLFFCIFGVYTVLLLRKLWPGNSVKGFRLNHISYEVLIRISSNFDAWIHCIMPINMWVIIRWHISLFSAFFSVFSVFLHFTLKFGLIFHHNIFLCCYNLEFSS